MQITIQDEVFSLKLSPVDCDIRVTLHRDVNNPEWYKLHFEHERDGTHGRVSATNLGKGSLVQLSKVFSELSKACLKESND
jgi:hypothetical protein